MYRLNHVASMDYAQSAVPLGERLRRWRPRGMQRVNWMLGAWSVLVFLFLYVPIGILVLWSFNNMTYDTRWHGFTTRWYEGFWQRSMYDLREWAGDGSPKLQAMTDKLGAAERPDALKGVPNAVRNQIKSLREGLVNSLFVGVIATTLSVILGTISAWITFKYKYPLHSALNTLVAVPMIVPEIIMGVSLLMLIGLAGTLLKPLGIPFERGFIAIIIAHVTFSFPFVMVTIQARLAGIDPALEEAAMDLGATPAVAFRKVIVPYLMPAIISGTLMAFTLSLDDFVVTFFVKDGASETLPIRIYGGVKLPPAMLHVVSTIMIGITVLMVVLSELIKRVNR